VLGHDHVDFECTGKGILSTNSGIFAVREYNPPWWARNKHVNTIIGALFATPPLPAYRRERWDTEDGDFVDIDFLSAETKTSRGIVLLYHGLESNTNAPLTVRQAISLSKAGFDVAAVSFRGCSGEDNRTPGAYHLGFTKDIRYILVSNISLPLLRFTFSDDERFDCIGYWCGSRNKVY
jgi:predicted alpha/beta-fold hydrolase